MVIPFGCSSDIGTMSLHVQRTMLVTFKLSVSYGTPFANRGNTSRVIYAKCYAVHKAALILPSVPQSFT